MKKILGLLDDLLQLVKKQADKESRYAHGETKVFTEFLKELEFYRDEIIDLEDKEGK
jgi:hypothetical protein